MSMLGEQIKELREAARNIQGNLGRCLYRRKDVDEMQQVSGMLIEAADTIESLRDRLEEVGNQACHATQPNYEHCKYSTNREWRDTSRYSELFGTPERAAWTLEHGKVLCEWCDRQTCSTSGGECRIWDYDALLEWLGSDA